ncbi:hypothetical protein HYR99_37135 [Candidatus Poribacteria bacterium]|nr:hypothetical protein [Candidatus Poribacteria bacterium]
MPLYDLTKLQFPGDDSIYHHFHASWLIALADALNRTFPEESGFEAIFEKKVNPLEADVVTIDSLAEGVKRQFVAQCRRSQLPSPAVSFINPTFPDDAKDLTLRTASGKVVSVIELTSPGNKDAQISIDSIRRKKADAYAIHAVSYLQRGINYLVIDVLPPTNFVDTFHNSIAALLEGDRLTPPGGRPFYIISYNVRMVAGDVRMDVYPYWLRLGETLPQVPLFLVEDLYIAVDLEITFMEAIERLPPRHRRRLCESYLDDASNI